MKRIIATAAALAAILMFADSTAQAQRTVLHPNGFPYPGMNACSGIGLGNFGFGLQLEREQPPFFAKYPPVYYSHAVKRPYGVSPYAAPAGVVPVEITHSLPAVDPVVIENPHFPTQENDQEAAPEATESKVEKKQTVAGWQANPFFKSRKLAAK